ncbi:hypothetical protein [Acidisarcina polymorpha]|uniref:hypothetical protein n=1 Tax=Acidisarcina polymorpha TaxID=2211140 RepID=UPI001F41287F|nr:hypothetical protein [Acidisarcina polymorpha]
MKNYRSCLETHPQSARKLIRSWLDLNPQSAGNYPAVHWKNYVLKSHFSLHLRFSKALKLLYSFVYSMEITGISNATWAKTNMTQRSKQIAATIMTMPDAVDLIRFEKTYYR